MGMAIRLTQETEQLLRDEIGSGQFSSVDDLIVQGVLALRDLSRRQSAKSVSADARRRAVERIRELRQGVRLQRNGETLREYAHLGHRY